MTVKLLTEHHLEFLSLKGDCSGSSESTLVKMPLVGNHMTRLKYSDISHFPVTIVLTFILLYLHTVVCFSGWYMYVLVQNHVLLLVGFF